MELLRTHFANRPLGAPVITLEAMARQHASPDNMLIVTYVNKNRLDFALTWVRHLLAANQPHRSRFRAL